MYIYIYDLKNVVFQLLMLTYNVNFQFLFFSPLASYTCAFIAIIILPF